MGKPTNNSAQLKLYSAHVQTITSQQPIVDILSTILTLQIPTAKQMPQCLFSTSGIDGIDQALNGIKADVIKCFNKSLEFIFNSKTLMNPNHNKFYAFSSSSGIQGILQSIFTFCEHPSINIEAATRV